MAIHVTGAYDLSAAAERNRNSMMLAAGDGSMGVIDGVHSGMKISKTTGMGFTIGAGRAAVNGDSDSDGTLTVAFTNSQSGSFEDGHSTYDRWDRVVIQTDSTKPGPDAAEVKVIKGSANDSPIPPGTPDGALKLYDVKILAGTNAGNGGWSTSNSKDRRNKIGVPEFVDYTPTFGGFTALGSGSIREGQYRTDGDKCTVNVHLKGGSGANMGTQGALYFTLPIPAAGKWIYYGLGAVHHPDINGLAYDLRIISTGDTAHFWATNPGNALVQPGQLGYPFQNGTEIYLSLEYIIEIP